MRSFVVCAVLLLGLGVGLRADTFLDFDIVGIPGSVVSYAGGSAPIVGSDISAITVQGVNTPSNPGLLTISNGVLDFNTGAGSGLGGWTWSGTSGNSITIVGGVPSLFIPDGTLLLSGTFGAAEVSSLGGNFKVVIASFVDYKDETLADYFGLQGGNGVLWSGNMNLSFIATAAQYNAFKSTSVVSGNVYNSVPEPASILGLGTVLLLVGSRLRRKRA